MNNQDYYNDIVALLLGLSSEQNSERKLLYNLLFDMSIDLSYCHGAIQSITTDQSLPINPSRLQVLSEAEKRLESLVVSFRKALIEGAKSSESSE